MQPGNQNLSHFFTIRLWFESLESDIPTVRIKVHHILSGEVRYFRDWAKTVEFISEHAVGNEDHQFNREED